MTGLVLVFSSSGEHFSDIRRPQQRLPFICGWRGWSSEALFLLSFIIGSFLHKISARLTLARGLLVCAPCSDSPVIRNSAFKPPMPPTRNMQAHAAPAGRNRSVSVAPLPCSMSASLLLTLLWTA